MPRKKQASLILPSVAGTQVSDHVFSVEASAEAEKLLGAIRMTGSDGPPKSLFAEGTIFSRLTVRVLVLKSPKGKKDDITHWLLAECRGTPDLAKDGFMAFGFSKLGLEDVRGLCRNIIAGVSLMGFAVTVLPDSEIFIAAGGAK